MEFFSTITDEYEYWYKLPYEDFEAYEYRFYDEPINTWWTLVTAGFVYVACIGLAVWETGMIRKRNTSAAWARIVITWFFTFANCYVFSYAFAFGDYNTVYKQKFIGGRNYFAGWNWNSISGTHFSKFWLQAALATLVNSIIGSFLSDRGRIVPFLVFIALYTFFFYPVVLAWDWGGGWLDQWGFVDYGGSSVIFLNAAFSGASGIFFTGPRFNFNKFYRNAVPEDEKKVEPLDKAKNEEVQLGKIKVMALDDGSEREEEGPGTNSDLPNTVSVAKADPKKVFSVSTVNSSPLPHGLLTMNKLKEIRLLAKNNEDFECVHSHGTFAVVGIFLFWIGVAFLNGFSTRELASDGWLSVERGIMATFVSGAMCGLLSFLSYQPFLLLLEFHKYNHRNNLIGLCKGVIAGTVAISAGGGDYKPWHAVVIAAFTCFFLLLLSKIEQLIILMDDPAGLLCPLISGGIVGTIFIGFLDEENIGTQVGHNILGMLVISIWALAPSTLFWMFGWYLRTCQFKVLRWTFLDEMVGINHQEQAKRFKLKAKINY